jgi:hypothetical protein
LIRLGILLLRTTISDNIPSTYGFNYTKKRSNIKENNSFSSERFLKDFYFQGNIKPERKGFTITNSHSGCLIKPTPKILRYNRLWKNFHADLEIEFPEQKLEINKHQFINNTGKYQKTESEKLKISHMKYSLKANGNGLLGMMITVEKDLYIDILGYHCKMKET